MKILITGSRGYIGYNLVDYLKKMEPETEIIGLDPCSHPDSRSRHSNQFTIHENILDAELPLDIDIVIHLAGKTGVGDSWDPNNIKSYYESNVLASQKIFHTYSRPPYKSDIPILYATSSSVNEMKSPYAMTKAMVESIAPQTAIGMRFFTVYGGKIPRSDMFYSKALNNKVDSITNNKRDFTHVDYVCYAIHALMTLGKQGRIYDIGMGKPQSPREFLNSQNLLTDEYIPLVQNLSESKETKADPTEIEKILRIYRLNHQPHT